MTLHSFVLRCVPLLCCAALSHAEVLVQGSGLSITSQDVVADSLKVPEEARKAALAKADTVSQVAVSLFARRALADEARRENLSLHIEADNPLQLARQAISGQHPQVHVSGDAAFADTMNWLLEHVHWNGEADLARLIGADAARQVVEITRPVRTALQRFASAFAPASAPHARSGCRAARLPLPLRAGRGRTTTAARPREIPQ